MEVIRIEHPHTGLGLFRSPMKIDNLIITNMSLIESLDCYNDIIIKHEYFYSPKEEKLKFIPNKHYCAFKSIDQLNEWFTKDQLIAIYSLGFKIFSIKLSKYIEGKYQVVFRKRDIIQMKNITSNILEI